MTADRRWFVVDRETGIPYHPGHTEPGPAYLELADRLNNLPGDNPDRYVVEQQEVSPWAYAIPVQTAPC